MIFTMMRWNSREKIKIPIIIKPRFWNLIGNLIGNLIIELFDERDVFLFDINNMLNLESNIPSKIF